MKKLFALTVCLALIIACFAACQNEDADAQGEQTTVPSTPAASTAEATLAPEPTPHINYKGLETLSFTEDDMRAAEGREEDFEVPWGDDSIMYVYNNVTFDTLAFTQVQYTFSEQFNRISCTYTGDEPEVTQESYRAAMTAIYGEPTQASTGTGESVYTWRDGITANYLQLTQLNEATVQLVFYLCEGVQ